MLTLSLCLAACSQSQPQERSGNGGANTGRANTGGANTGGTNNGGDNAGGASSGQAGGWTAMGGTNRETAGTLGSGGNTLGNGGDGVDARTGGTSANGGTRNTDGAIRSGGTADSGATSEAASSSSCSGADSAETTRVSGWLTNTNSGLPNYAYSNIKKYFASTDSFDRLVCAIVMGCTEFAPSAAHWLEYCEAVITSAIVAESSYNPSSVVVDSYATRSLGGATANDPTVGLLQDRFSSTVHDYNYYGSFTKMAAIGCTWPTALQTQTDTSTFWATAGGTTYLALMQDPSCNIALATWYYFLNATGNGGASATYSAQYCQGKGVAGTMVIGLLSHLQGPGFTRPPDASNPYVTGIKARFISLLGGALPSPDPFAQALPPEPTKFCR